MSSFMNFCTQTPLLSFNFISFSPLTQKVRESKQGEEEGKSSESEMVQIPPTLPTSS